jgi:hypothetical protein
MPQLARFMDGTVLHNGFLAFKVTWSEVVEYSCGAPHFPMLPFTNVGTNHIDFLT